MPEFGWMYQHDARILSKACDCKEMALDLHYEVCPRKVVADDKKQTRKINS